MSGIGKTVKKIIPKELQKLDPVGTKINKEGIRTFESINPKMPSAEAGPVIPMPDEDEIRRNKRRGQAARGGGRASTILTESDRLGP